MPSFASYDGTEIGYRLLGDGPPLVCLPAAPVRADPAHSRPDRRRRDAAAFAAAIGAFLGRPPVQA